MKFILLILFPFIPLCIFPQESPEALSKKITGQSKTDREKVDAIFQWITSNISYKTKPVYKSQIKSRSQQLDASVDDDSLWKPLNLLVAETVLQKRVAVCDGYSRLFAVLCAYAGIHAEVIVGYARTGFDKPSKRFGVNHYWNAVCIDDKWYLLDATWASGYLSRQGDVFIRDYDEKYFLTPPEEFMKDHYPDDTRWTLLPENKYPEEFRYTPFRQRSFVKYNIMSYFPSTGIIEAFPGDTIRLRVKANNNTDRKISPSEVQDSAYYASEASILLQPDPSGMNKSNSVDNPTYTFAVPDRPVQWLYLLYNNDVILRYKLNVKKKEERSTASL